MLLPKNWKGLWVGSSKIHQAFQPQDWVRPPVKAFQNWHLLQRSTINCCWEDVFFCLIRVTWGLCRWIRELSNYSFSFSGNAQQLTKRGQLSLKEREAFFGNLLPSLVHLWTMWTSFFHLWSYVWMSNSRLVGAPKAAESRLLVGTREA